MSGAVKTCRKCHVEQPATEFYVHPAMGDGRLNKCKQCSRREAREHYLANLDRYREYDRCRANASHRVAARNSYAKTKQGKDAHKRACRKYAERYPLKRAAHVLVGNALRDGRLETKPCEVCGHTKAQAHHDDYGKPLEVRWLCTDHHVEWHLHNTPIYPAEEAA